MSLGVVVVAARSPLPLLLPGDGAFSIGRLGYSTGIKKTASNCFATDAVAASDAGEMLIAKLLPSTEDMEPDSAVINWDIVLR